MFTRKEIVDFSVRMWCKKDLLTKGMVVSLAGDVICIATLSDDYRDGIYYKKNIKSPIEADYCGVYSIRANCRLDSNDAETRKNIAVTKTDGIKKFVYFFEKTGVGLDEYFFHGRYKYIGHRMIPGINPNHKEDILFQLLFIDRPILR